MLNSFCEFRDFVRSKRSYAIPLSLARDSNKVGVVFASVTKRPSEDTMVSKICSYITLRWYACNYLGC